MTESDELIENVINAQIELDGSSDDDLLIYADVLIELDNWNQLAADAANGAVLQYEAHEILISSRSGDFPSAPYDPLCGSVRRSQTIMDVQLGLFLAAEIVRESALRACQQTALGANTSGLCVATDIIFFIAKGVWEHVLLCEANIDAAEIEGTYDRVGHIHTDIETLDSNLATTEADIVTRIDTAETNLDTRIDTAETNLDSRINTAETNLDTRINTAETNLTSRINTAETNLTTRINTFEDNITTLILANSDGIEANAQAIERLREILCDIERLLHTPQGQRESECENCDDQPGFPYSWPKNNSGEPIMTNF